MAAAKPEQKAAAPAAAGAGANSVVKAAAAPVSVKSPPWYKPFVCAAMAASWAEVCTIPLDTVKVRLQIQGNAPAGTALKYKGFGGTFATIAKEEGVTALWKGLTPGLLRQCVFGTLRIGLYDHVKAFYHSGPGDASLGIKILTGLTTGAIGISVASPTDLVKIRLQAEGRLPPGVPRRYNGTIDAFSKIFREEKITGFWKGVGPNIVRNSIINAAELATYDQAKEVAVKQWKWADNLTTHLVCATTAGFVATCAGSPADVVKTRVMNQKINADGTKQYKNAIHCLTTVIKNEGPMALYKGFWPNFARIGTWNIVMFLTREQLTKRLFNN